jgi:antitoxin VapB
MSTKSEVEKTEVLAELFKHGRSQAVRLPKEFWFEGTEVSIRRVGERVLLEPILPEDQLQPISEF